MSKCPDCGEEVPEGKLGMHNRVVHTPDALYLYHDDPEVAADE
jgi:hypothetical protein